MKGSEAITQGIEDETRANDFAYPMLIELRPEARANVRQGQYDTLGCQLFLEFYDGAAAEQSIAVMAPASRTSQRTSVPVTNLLVCSAK